MREETGPLRKECEGFQAPTAGHRTECGVPLSVGPAPSRPCWVPFSIYTLAWKDPGSRRPFRHQEINADEKRLTEGTFAFRSRIQGQLRPDMILQGWRSARCSVQGRGRASGTVPRPLES